MKKIIFLLITVLLVYLIYNLSIKKTNYLLINDSIIGDLNNYLTVSGKDKIYQFSNNSIYKVYQDIINNNAIKINDDILYSKKVLRETDIIIISVGMEELNSNFDKYNMNNNYNYFNTMVLNIKNLINEISKYNYGKVVFLGLYNPKPYYDSSIDQFFYNVDIVLNRLMNENNAIYIPLYELIKCNNYRLNNSIYLNIYGKKSITALIENYLQ